MSSEPSDAADRAIDVDDASRVAGKVIVVTGAASGIGRALAEGFRGDGAFVVGADRPQHRDAAAEASDLAIGIDVRSAEDNERLVAEAVAAGGRLDAFVANAGVSSFGRVEDQEWAHIDRVWQVNVAGVLHAMRVAIPVMREQGSGRFVVTASRNGEQCPPKMMAYNMSKAAAVAAVRTLAHELVGTDILVNNLIPGVSATGIWGSADAPPGSRDPAEAYPTARALATLPTGGPSGRTFFDGAEWPMYDGFSA